MHAAHVKKKKKKKRTKPLIPSFKIQNLHFCNKGTFFLKKIRFVFNGNTNQICA